MAFYQQMDVNGLSMNQAIDLNAINTNPLLTNQQGAVNFFHVNGIQNQQHNIDQNYFNPPLSDQNYTSYQTLESINQLRQISNPVYMNEQPIVNQELLNWMILNQKQQEIHNEKRQMYDQAIMNQQSQSDANPTNLLLNRGYLNVNGSQTESIDYRQINRGQNQQFFFNPAHVQSYNDHNRLAYAMPNNQNEYFNGYTPDLVKTSNSNFPAQHHYNAPGRFLDVSQFHDKFNQQYQSHFRIPDAQIQATTNINERYNQGLNTDSQIMTQPYQIFNTKGEIDRDMLLRVVPLIANKQQTLEANNERNANAFPEEQRQPNDQAKIIPPDDRYPQAYNVELPALQSYERSGQNDLTVKPQVDSISGQGNTISISSEIVSDPEEKQTFYSSQFDVDGLALDSYPTKQESIIVCLGGDDDDEDDDNDHGNEHRICDESKNRHAQTDSNDGVCDNPAEKISYEDSERGTEKYMSMNNEMGLSEEPLNMETPNDPLFTQEDNLPNDSLSTQEHNLLDHFQMHKQLRNEPESSTLQNQADKEKEGNANGVQANVVEQKSTKSDAEKQNGGLVISVLQKQHPEDSQIKDNQRIDQQETRIDNQEARIDHQEARIDHQEARIDHQEARIDHQEALKDVLTEKHLQDNHSHENHKKNRSEECLQTPGCGSLETLTQGIQQQPEELEQVIQSNESGQQNECNQREPKKQRQHDKEKLVFLEGLKYNTQNEKHQHQIHVQQQHKQQFQRQKQQLRQHKEQLQMHDKYCHPQYIQRSFGHQQLDHQQLVQRLQQLLNLEQQKQLQQQQMHQKRSMTPEDIAMHTELRKEYQQASNIPTSSASARASNSPVMFPNPMHHDSPNASSNNNRLGNLLTSRERLLMQQRCHSFPTSQINSSNASSEYVGYSKCQPGDRFMDLNITRKDAESDVQRDNSTERAYHRQVFAEDGRDEMTHGQKEIFEHQRYRQPVSFSSISSGDNNAELARLSNTEKVLNFIDDVERWIAPNYINSERLTTRSNNPSFSISDTGSQLMQKRLNEEYTYPYGFSKNEPGTLSGLNSNTNVHSNPDIADSTGNDVRVRKTKHGVVVENKNAFSELPPFVLGSNDFSRIWGNQNLPLRNNASYTDIIVDPKVHCNSSGEPRSRVTDFKSRLINDQKTNNFPPRQFSYSSISSGIQTPVSREEWWRSLPKDNMEHKPISKRQQDFVNKIIAAEPDRRSEEVKIPKPGIVTPRFSELDLSQEEIEKNKLWWKELNDSLNSQLQSFLNESQQNDTLMESEAQPISNSSTSVAKASEANNSQKLKSKVVSSERKGRKIVSYKEAGTSMSGNNNVDPRKAASNTVIAPSSNLLKRDCTQENNPRVEKDHRRNDVVPERSGRICVSRNEVGTQQAPRLPETHNYNRTLRNGSFFQPRGRYQMNARRHEHKTIEQQLYTFISVLKSSPAKDNAIQTIQNALTSSHTGLKADYKVLTDQPKGNKPTFHGSLFIGGIQLARVSGLNKKALKHRVYENALEKLTTKTVLEILSVEKDDVTITTNSRDSRVTRVKRIKPEHKLKERLKLLKDWMIANQKSDMNSIVFLQTAFAESQSNLSYSYQKVPVPDFRAGARLLINCQLHVDAKIFASAIGFTWKEAKVKVTEKSISYLLNKSLEEIQNNLLRNEDTSTDDEVREICNRYAEKKRPNPEMLLDLLISKIKENNFREYRRAENIVGIEAADACQKASLIDATFLNNKRNGNDINTDDAVCIRSSTPGKDIKTFTKEKSHDNKHNGCEEKRTELGETSKGQDKSYLKALENECICLKYKSENRSEKDHSQIKMNEWKLSDTEIDDDKKAGKAVLTMIDEVGEHQYLRKAQSIKVKDNLENGKTKIVNKIEETEMNDSPRLGLINKKEEKLECYLTMENEKDNSFILPASLTTDEETMMVLAEEQRLNTDNMSTVLDESNCSNTDNNFYSQENQDKAIVRPGLKVIESSDGNSCLLKMGEGALNSGQSDLKKIDSIVTKSEETNIFFKDDDKVSTENDPSTSVFSNENLDGKSNNCNVIEVVVEIHAVLDESEIASMTLNDDDNENIDNETIKDKNLESTKIDDTDFVVKRKSESDKHNEKCDNEDENKENSKEGEMDKGEKDVLLNSKVDEESGINHLVKEVDDKNSSVVVQNSSFDEKLDKKDDNVNELDDEIKSKTIEECDNNRLYDNDCDKFDKIEDCLTNEDGKGVRVDEFEGDKHEVGKKNLVNISNDNKIEELINSSQLPNERNIELVTKQDNDLNAEEEGEETDSLDDKVRSKNQHPHADVLMLSKLCIQLKLKLTTIFRKVEERLNFDSLPLVSCHVFVAERLVAIATRTTRRQAQNEAFKIARRTLAGMRGGREVLDTCTAMKPQDVKGSDILDVVYKGYTKTTESNRCRLHRTRNIGRKRRRDINDLVILEHEDWSTDRVAHAHCILNQSASLSGLLLEWTCEEDYGVWRCEMALQGKELTRCVGKTKRDALTLASVKALFSLYETQPIIKAFHAKSYSNVWVTRDTLLRNAAAITPTIDTVIDMGRIAGVVEVRKKEEIGQNVEQAIENLVSDHFHHPTLLELVTAPDWTNGQRRYMRQVCKVKDLKCVPEDKGQGDCLVATMRLDLSQYVEILKDSPNQTQGRYKLLPDNERPSHNDVAGEIAVNDSFVGSIGSHQVRDWLCHKNQAVDGSGEDRSDDYVTANDDNNILDVNREEDINEHQDGDMRIELTENHGLEAEEEVFDNESESSKSELVGNGSCINAVLPAIRRMLRPLSSSTPEGSKSRKKSDKQDSVDNCGVIEIV